MSNFIFDRNKISTVEVYYPDGVIPDNDNNIYEVGDWTFDKRDDGDIESAETAIYAWIAWYEYLKNDSDNLL